jgi:hypothetical protein
MYQASSSLIFYDEHSRKRSGLFLKCLLESRLPRFLFSRQKIELKKRIPRGKRKERRLRRVFTRVVLAVACILAIIWPSKASLATQRARLTGVRGKRVQTERKSVEKFLSEKKTSTKSSASAHAAAADATFPLGSSISESALPVNAQLFRSLSFQVCNGFTNQRLSIVYAAIIAKETGRSLRLPRLLLDGTQHDTSRAATLINSDATEFRTFYDVKVFTRGMKTAGVRVLDMDSALFSPSDKVVRVPSKDLQTLLGFGDGCPYRNATHLSIECPLFKLDLAVVGQHRELIENVLASLVPAPAQRAKIDQLKVSLSKSGHYNFLHLRVERDWINHCKTWVSDRGVCVAEEVIRAIGQHLDLKGVSRGTLLYVACDLPAAETDLLNAAMKSLKAMGYKKVTLQGRPKEGRSTKGRKSSGGSSSSREIRAMEAYYLGMDSEKYIGNSVSTFSALLLLERQNQNRWSTYYNMGGIPLMDMLPFFRMPWVFTFNGESPGFDYMAKSAVLSAIHIGQLIPYCIYMGHRGDEMYQWLKRKGVHVVLHDPSWKVNIVQKYDEAKEFAKIAATYESITSLVATFMRFEIPIIHALYQYNYVLYTDIDVLFLEKIHLHSFPPELPKALVMSHEVDYKFPCNAGVILYNLPYMRQSYNDLITFAMHAPGLHFGDKYGPADQGALNQFYERELGSKCSLPEKFNAKPYKLGDFGSLKEVSILHFHGPKPKHYLDYANDRGCGPFLDAVGGGEFVKLCEKGLKNMCEIQLDIPISMRSEGSWGPLSKLQSSACKR